MRDDYLIEKFGKAVHGLATSAGSIQHRLLNVAVSNLSMILSADDFSDDFPPDLRRRILNLGQRLTSSEEPHEHGRVGVTTSKLSDEEAVEIAEEIYSINYELRSYRDEQHGR